MKWIINILLICYMLTFVYGCAAPVNNYGISIENVESLRDIKERTANKINIGTFTSDNYHKSIICRGSIPITIPNDQTFEDYIKNAFINELKLAQIYDENSDIILNGHFEEIDFNSTFIGSAYWIIRIKLYWEGKNLKDSFTVESKYPFSASYIGDRACQEVPQAFVPAVQQFIKKIIHHPKFIDTIRN